jgi:hypothetical protein
MISTPITSERQKLMIMGAERWNEQDAETSETTGEILTLGARLWKVLDALLLALGAVTVSQYAYDDETIVFCHNWMTGC